MSGPGWWVRAGERAYGPYPPERLPGFVAEGRIVAATPVARSEAGPWTPAGREPELQPLFDAPAAPRPASGSAPTPAAWTPQMESLRVGAQPFLVVAGLAASSLQPFVAALAELGAFVPAREGVWLLRAAGDAPTVRNALSRALGTGDTLFVVRASLGESAWFNLDGAADRSLRQLWTAPAGRHPIERRSRA